MQDKETIAKNVLDPIVVEYIARYANNALNPADIAEFIECIKAPGNQTSAKVIALLDYIFQLGISPSSHCL